MCLKCESYIDDNCFEYYAGYQKASLSVEYVLVCQCKKFVFDSNFHLIEEYTDTLIGMYQVLKKTSMTHCFNLKNSVTKTEDWMDNCFTELICIMGTSIL